MGRWWHVLCLLRLAACKNSTFAACRALQANFGLTIICDSILSLATGYRAPVARSSGFKVIGAGLGRTGTASLQEAFQILGFNSYHMSEVLPRHDHLVAWNATLASGSVRDVLPLLLEGGFDASADEPVNHYTLQLMREFPEAKVVLTTRPDVQRWTRSIGQIADLMGVIELQPWRRLLGAFKLWSCDFHRLRGYNLENGSGALDNAAMEKYYDSWNARIRAEVPAERLLDFRVEEGWEPLCKFLGLPVPDVPFPRVNDKNGMQIAITVLTALSCVWAFSPYLLLCLLFWYVRRGSPTKARSLREVLTNSKAEVLTKPKQS